MSEIRIGELRLRIPGLSPLQARALAENISHRIADGLTEQGAKGRFGLLELRVPVPRGSSPDRIEAAVAKSILQGLTRRRNVKPGVC
jgi:hypothetical protein